METRTGEAHRRLARRRRGRLIRLPGTPKVSRRSPVAAKTAVDVRLAVLHGGAWRTALRGAFEFVREVGGGRFHTPRGRPRPRS